MLVEILRGAGDKAREAGIAIVGGHTIQTEEPIFGLAVVGRVHPSAVITNAGAQPGDFLVLSKPLGLGIITTAAKRGEDPRAAVHEALEVMTTLNRDAAVVMAAAGAHAMTDITGFGLLGHLRNITAASAVSATIWNNLVPVLSGGPGIRPGGHRTRRHPRQPPLPLEMGRIRPGPRRMGAAPALRRPDIGRAAGRAPRLACRGSRSAPPLPRPGAAAIVGCIDAGEPGRIRVHRAPESPIEGTR